VSQCKITFKCILWIWNFREFIRFFQTGLNPFKIQGIFKFEFVLEFVTWNPEGISCCAKNKSYSLCFKLSLCKIWRILDIEKPLFWISNFKRLKILEIRIELGPACQSEPPSNRAPGRWPHACAIAASHAPGAWAPPVMCATPIAVNPYPLRASMRGQSSFDFPHL
jgi:hypothetical protein